MLAAILHSRFVRVGPPLGSGKTISVLLFIEVFPLGEAVSKIGNERFFSTSLSSRERAH